MKQDAIETPATVPSLRDFYGSLYDHYATHVRSISGSRPTAIAEERSSYCEGCLTLDICGQLSAITVIEKEVRLDTSKHAGLRSVLALQRSADTCPCCACLWRQAETTVRTRFGANQGPLKLPSQLSDAPLAISAGRDREDDAPYLVLRLSLVPKCTDGTDHSLLFTNNILGILSLEVFSANSNHLSGTGGDLPSTLWFLDPDPTSIKSIDKMKSWLDECSTHADCNSATGLLPDRYIDVGTLLAPEARLCESDSSENGPYLTLSYCWGGANTYVLNDSNMEHFKSGFDETLLPATLRNTFYLARQLGLRYVWIDALCIIQGNALDWQTQSAKMRDVYSNSTVTICASSAFAASEGFLHLRPPSHVFCGTLQEKEAKYAAYLTLATQASSLSHLFISGSGGGGQLVNEPLTQRAWTVQERLLSPRTIYFGSQRTIWACRTCTRAEDGLETGPQTEGLDEVTKENAYHQWGRICIQYASRQLTHESDRLPALSGVAQKFAEIVEDRYLAGHWERDLVASLMWWVPVHRMGLGKVAGMPSWSWASPGGGPTSKGSLNAPCKPIATVLGTDVRPAGADAFGQVRAGGSIVLRAPLLRVSLQYSTQDLPGLASGPSGEQIGILRFQGQSLDASIWPDNYDLLAVSERNATSPQRRRVDLFLLNYRPDDRDKSKWLLCGLVVERASELRSGTYRRVGAVEIHGDLEGTESWAREVTLV